eukprot:gene19703-25627_t
MEEFDGETYEDPFMKDLVNFVADSHFQSLFENYFIKYSNEFSDEEEHKLRYYELYTEFQKSKTTDINIDSKGVPSEIKNPTAKWDHDTNTNTIDSHPDSKVLTSFNPPTHVSSIASGICYENSDLSLLEFIIAPNKPFNAATLQVIADWDSEQDNLCEDMHRRINIDSLRHSHDIHIKPNLKDKEQIDRILAMTGNHSMSFEDMDLLYRFRYTLTDNPKALTKFLLAVDWNSDIEIGEVQGLLLMWKEHTDTMDIADALKLLGREKAYQSPLVREYAVEILQRASDDDLLSYLLQLVQALRYEPVSPLSTSTRVLSPLAKFLVTRGCKSPIVANYLYWYLKVEIEDDISGHMFQEIFDTFTCSLEARDLGRKKDNKEQALRKLLAERNLNVIPSKGPSKYIYGLNPASATMFASAVYPCVIELYTAPNNQVLFLLIRLCSNQATISDKIS